MRCANAGAAEMKLLLWLMLLISLPATADTVTCHIIYGGENFTVVAMPTGDPYAVKAEKIGRYFEFKAAYVTTPADLGAIALYVYGVASGDPVLIHEAKYSPGVGNGAAPWGFTGFQYVYEPSKSSELQYWCEKTS